MRILINHLTRMSHPWVCVAGIDTSRSHVRPVLDSTQLGRDLLRGNGGPFSLGSVVDLGAVDPRPTAPELEDVVFTPAKVRWEKVLESARFAELMERTTKASLKEIFGDELVRLSGTAAAVPEGRGIASLGVLKMDGGGDLDVRPGQSGPEVRFTFEDPDLGELSLKVTDLRLWRPDHVTPAEGRIKAIRPFLHDCIVAVGLTRFWQASLYPGFGHWLQINNVFPMEDPLWTTE